MSESNHPVIEFDHVSKIYPNGVVGLKDIDLTINQGEFVVVVGLSGAGKSTLMRAINGFTTSLKAMYVLMVFPLPKQKARNY